MHFCSFDLFLGRIASSNITVPILQFIVFVNQFPQYSSQISNLRQLQQSLLYQQEQPSMEKVTLSPGLEQVCSKQIQSEYMLSDGNSAVKKSQLSVNDSSSESHSMRPPELEVACNSHLCTTPSEQHEAIKQSLQRQFQFKLQRERQSQSLLIEKLRQEVEMLKKDIEVLSSSKNKLQKELLKLKQEKQEEAKSFQYSELEAQQQKNHSVTGSELKNVKHFQVLLEELEKEHEMCLENKKKHLEVQETLTFRVRILQEQNKQLALELKTFHKNHQNSTELSSKVKDYEAQIKTLQHANKRNEQNFKNELSQLEKQISKMLNSSKPGCQASRENGDTSKNQENCSTKFKGIDCECCIEKNKQSYSDHDSSLFSRNLYQLQLQREKSSTLRQMDALEAGISLGGDPTSARIYNIKMPYSTQRVTLTREERSDSGYPNEHESFPILEKDQLLLSRPPLSDKELIKEMYKKNTQIFKGSNSSQKKRNQQPENPQFIKESNYKNSTSNHTNAQESQFWTNSPHENKKGKSGAFIKPLRGRRFSYL